MTALWDRELAFGSLGEEVAAGQLAWWLGNPERLRVEVKTKRIPDLKLYVEHTNARTGEPSGIRVTEADLWHTIIALGRQPSLLGAIGIVIPVPLLRLALAAGLGAEVEHSASSTPTRGRLVHLGSLLNYWASA